MLKMVIAKVTTALLCMPILLHSVDISLLKDEQTVVTKANEDAADGNLAAAETEYLRARSLAHRLAQTKHANYHLETDVLWRLGGLYSKEKQLSKAENAYRDRLAILVRSQQKFDPDIGIALFDLQSLYESMNRDAETSEMVRKGIAFYSSCEKRDKPLIRVCDRRLADVQGLYGEYLFNRHRFDFAEPYLRAVVLRANDAVRPEILGSALLALGFICYQRGNFSEAKSLGQRAHLLQEQYPNVRVIPLPK